MSTFAIYGAGEMGSQIADGFQRRGDAFVVHDPYVTKPWPGSDLSKETIATAADVHLITVRGVQVAEDVIFGDDGLLRYAHPDSVILLMTTMTPVDARRLGAEAARRGFRRTGDAAMSRRRGAIEDRSLTVLLGADRDVAEAAVDECAVFADNVDYVGPLGSGMAAKLVNNWLLQANRGALLRAVRAASAFGIGVDTFVSLIDRSSGSSWVSAQWSEAERSLLQGNSVDPSLAARTEEEIEMLVASMRATSVEFDPSPVTDLIAAMKGTQGDHV